MTAAPSPIAGNPAASSDRFGHPRALTYLFATEMWERFSYYGMRALLVLYMVKYLLLTRSSAGQVLGLAAFQAGAGIRVRPARRCSRSPRRSTASTPASFI